MTLSLVKLPSGWVPMGMSLAALAVVTGQVALFGTTRQADEGAAAHLWQIFVVAQLPVMAFFAIKWLPRASRQAVGVLALQVVGLLAALAPVFLLGL